MGFVGERDPYGGCIFVEVFVVRCYGVDLDKFVGMGCFDDLVEIAREVRGDCMGAFCIETFHN